MLNYLKDSNSKLFKYNTHNFKDLSHFNKLCSKIENLLNINLKVLCLDFYNNKYNDVLVRYNDDEISFWLSKITKTRDFEKSKSATYKFKIPYTNNEGEY